jgi:hypothetical protein
MNAHAGRALLLFFTFSAILLSTPEQIELRINSAWQNISPIKSGCHKYKSSWILAGTFEFKKKAVHQPIHLDRLVLSWKGDRLDRLTASLYKKPLDKKFFPLQEYLIAESFWNQKTQQIIFKLNQALSLETHTIFCLVLSVSPEIAPHLPTGWFEIERSCLPIVVQQALTGNQPLTLAHRD